MIQHHLHLERQVNLGGVRLGPLQLFGRRYSLRAMPLITWIQWERALHLLRAMDPRGDELQTNEVLLVFSMEALRPLIRFLIPDVHAVDEKYLTREELREAFRASSEVNDFPFTESVLMPKEKGPAPPSDWTLEDTVDALVTLRPCYVHAAVWRLPAHEFCAHVTTLDAGARNPRPTATRPTRVLPRKTHSRNS